MAQTNVQAFSGDVDISSNLAVNTNDLFVDTENSRVGIGTVNPKTPLEVRQSAGYFRSMYIQKYLGAGPELATSYVLLLKSESNTPKRFSGKISGVRGYASNNNTFEAEIIAGVGRFEDLSGRMTFTFSGNSDKFYAKLVSLTYNSSTYIALALIPTANYNGMSGGIYFNGKTNAIDELQYITDLGTLSNIVDLPVSDGNKTTFTGDVGIGTASPSSQLELYGAGKDLTFKYDTGITRQSAANRDTHYSGLENSIKRVGDRNLFDGSLFTPDTTHEILFGFSDTYTQWSGLDEYYPSYNEMRFKLWSPTSSIVGSLTDVMTLRGDGSVGIGITDPGAKLDVVGGIKISGGQFRSEGYNVADNLGLVLEAGNPTEVSGESGTCGIGFNTRSRKNHIKGGILATPQSWGRADIHICTNNSVGSGSTEENYKVSVADARLTVLSTGNVGIGTDNPDRALHVNSSSCRFGNIKFNSGFAAQPANTSTGVNMKGFNGGGGVLFVMTFHNGSGDGTATRVVFLRKTYNATWTQSSTNTTPIVSQHSTSTQNGTLSFDTSSDILRYNYSIGGNSHFYVIEFDGA